MALFFEYFRYIKIENEAYECVLQRVSEPNKRGERMKKTDVKFAEFVKANPKYKEPKVGMGVTELLYSDCHA